MQGKIFLRGKREHSLLRRHPWVFSGAVQRIEGEPEAGSTVDVYSHDGAWLGRGGYSPSSAIVCRIWTFDESEGVDRLFFHRRLAAALAYREGLDLGQVTNSWRWIHGEADGLPGIVIDRYGSYCVLQCSTVAAERWKKVLAETLLTFPGVSGVYDRSDVESRHREGLEPACGQLAGEEVPPSFTIEEYGLKLQADLHQGHKTGYYLDQRENRRLSGLNLAGKSVLNCFCYSGGFGVRGAMLGASSVTQVDAVSSALDLARANAELNGVADRNFTYIKGDVFQLLRTFRDSRRSFDVIILDPPKFAETQHQLEKACRGYKDINLLGSKLLNPGGTLLTFSCSAAMTPELFRKVVGDAVRDSHRIARVVRTLEQAPDHPRSLDFPEGDYLTGLELRFE